MQREAVRDLLLYSASAVLAGISVWLYYVEISPALAALDAWHAKNLAGAQAAPLQYRVLSYWIPELLVRGLGIAPWKAYLAERFFFLQIVGVLLYGFSRRWLSAMEGALSLLGFFYLYNLTVFAHFQPAEEINILFFLLGFIAIERREFRWLLLVVALGVFNKQTVVFLIPVYGVSELLLRGRFDRALIVHCVVLAAVFFSLRFTIRHVLGERPLYTDFWQIEHNLTAMASLDPRTYFFLLPSIVPMILIVCSWRYQPVLMRALVPTIPVFVAAHFAIGRMLEFRLFMPLALVTLPATLIFVRQFMATDSQELRSGRGRSRVSIMRDVR
jgi:hypothetical protein